MRWSISPRWKRAQYTVAQANRRTDDKATSSNEFVICRQAGDVLLMATSEVDLMDVSPKQLVSVAASSDSVPGKRRRQPCSDGLEHDASGRAAGTR